MFEEILYDDKTKYVRFYITHLPFEVKTEIENDGEEIMNWRLQQLQEDFNKYGDYLHSDLYVEKLKPIEE